VRGNASTYFSSKIEPWSECYDWKSPGFDPLRLAIKEAHSQNMALHAWINGELLSFLLFWSSFFWFQSCSHLFILVTLTPLFIVCFSYTSMYMLFLDGTVFFYFLV
jgi:hypothetical protein